MSLTFHVPIQGQTNRCTVQVPLSAIGAVINGVRADNADDRIANFTAKITAAVIDAVTATEHQSAAPGTSKRTADVAFGDLIDPIALDHFSHDTISHSGLATSSDTGTNAPSFPINQSLSAKPIRESIWGGTLDNAAGKDSLRITLRNGIDADVSYKITTTTQLGRVLSTYATLAGKDLRIYRMMFDGQRVNPTDTAESLDMEDGDIIFARLEVLGS